MAATVKNGKEDYSEDTQFYNYSSKIFQTKQQIQLKHKVLFILIEGTKE